MINSPVKYVILLLLIVGCYSGVREEKRVLSDPFFGLEPSDSAQLLAPNIISSGLFEYNGTFSPDGKEFYYTVNLPGRGQIVFLELDESNRWSEPKFAAFSSAYSDVDPLFSTDGSRLYFTSNRPINDTAESARSTIWFVERNGDGWSNPYFVSLTEKGDYYSSITNQGDIYFNSWSTGDIYKATETDSTYTVKRLPDIINLDKRVGDPFVSPNEDYLIFRGENMKDTYGSSDLYISFRQNNTWTQPVNLGGKINTKARESCPYVTVDGKLLVFSSTRIVTEYKAQPLAPLEPFKQKSASYDNGSWNIFYISAAFIDQLREQIQQD